MRRKAIAGVMVAMVVAMSMALAGPASAATVSGCAQGYSEYVGTCIWVVTGSKNSANHTQWVSTITVQAPRAARTTVSKFEAWAGNGPTGVAWYASARKAGSVKWTINKWIKNKSGICGAYTWTDGTGRSIACITIKA